MRPANWRSRRLHTCQAADVLHAVVAGLGSDNGEIPPPVDSVPCPITEDMRRELDNQVTCLMRTILLFSDGCVSPSSLQRF